MVQEPIERVGEDEYLADATQTLSAVFDFIDFDDPQPDDKDEANLQIGEWVYEQFSSIPKKDDSFTYYNLVVSVDSIEHNRILKVRIKVQKNEEPEKHEEAEK